MTTSTTQIDSPTGHAWRFAISVETTAYLVLFLAALLLRGIGLGKPSLGELEARQAIAAWHLLWPDIPGTGSIAGVLPFAGVVASFLLATPTSAAARFVPMLGGMALAFSPLLFRKRLGRSVTLLSVALLAISPTAVAASRQLDGTGLSMLGLVLALAALDGYADVPRSRLVLLAGIAFGFALLADYGTLLALLALAGGTALVLTIDKDDPAIARAIQSFLGGLPWHIFVAGLAGTLVIVGTLFFLAPGGLGAAADQLGQLADGLIHRPTGAPYLGLVILLYEPGLLLFGIAGMAVAYISDQPWQRLLAGWGIVALLVSLIYPGAMPFHSLWSVVPLAVLSGLAITTLLSLEHDAPTWEPWVHAATVAASLAMIYTRLSHISHGSNQASLVWPPNAPPEQVVFQITGSQQDILMAVVWVILVIIVWLAVASMWGQRSAWRGLGLGLALPALLAMVGESGSLAFTRADSAYELFHQYPAQATLATLVDTARQVSELATGNPDTASITVQGDPNGGLAWALREFKDITYVEKATPDVQTILVITPADGSDPSLGSSYVGQDLVVMRHWEPGGLDARQILTWVLYRSAPDAPAGEMRIILWVREDIYQLIPAGGHPLPDTGE